MGEKDRLQDEIQVRYAQEAVSSCNLSCGSNLTYADLGWGQKVLDLGCGRGLETLQAASLVGPEGEAVGLDLTPEMVRAAQENARCQMAVNVRFVVGEIEKLPLEDDYFDRVISNCVINHAKNKAAVFAEVFRVLRSGGSFIISDAVSKVPLPDSIKNDPAQWAECFGGAVTENEYLQAITQAGFGRIEVLSRREYVKNGYDFASLTIRAGKFI